MPARKNAIDIVKGLPPWALTLPLNSEDLGASQWQLGDDIYVGTPTDKTATHIEQSILRSTLTS
jgi:hypothetical protein